MAEKPDLLVTAETAATYLPQPNDVLVTPARAAELGWITERARTFKLSGKEGADKIIPLLRRLGSIYNRGANSVIEELDLFDVALPGGATLSIQLQQATPDTMKALGEFFEVLAGIVTKTDDTIADLVINDPDDACLLIQELKKEQ